MSMTITVPIPRAAELAEQLRPERLPPPAERKAKRVAARVTQGKAARTLGINVKTLIDWEKRDRRWNRRHREAYEQLLAAFDLIAAEIAAEKSQK